MTKIAVLGAGNLGKSLIGGLVRHHYPAQNIWATGLDEKKLALVEKQFNVHVTTDNLIAANAADVIVLAVKPIHIHSVLKHIKESLSSKRQLIISVAAGITIASMRTVLGDATPIVRAMPNVGALIGQSATALYASSTVTQQEHTMAEKILTTLGLVVWVNEEKMLNSITALSGCGPAYFFLLMEALYQAAEQLDIPKELAYALIVQTAIGAAQYAKTLDKPFAEIIAHIAAKGGSTERALAVLNAHPITAIFSEALQAAKARCDELSEGK